jgi:hypothetical protein
VGEGGVRIDRDNFARISQGERKVQKTGRMRYLTIPGDRVLAVENWDGTTPRYLSIALLRDFAFALEDFLEQGDALMV